MVAGQQSGILMASVVSKLAPGRDLRLAIAELAAAEAIEAGVIVSAVGSLQRALLRNAGASKILTIAGPLEIVSATGTVSATGMHIHISVADPLGKVTGGHLVEGCIVGSTAEIVILRLPDYSFSREYDSSTGYAELVVNRLKS
jgi:uncharacterized protein